MGQSKSGIISEFAGGIFGLAMCRMVPALLIQTAVKYLHGMADGLKTRARKEAGRSAW
jgi:hypothetical protein